MINLEQFGIQPGNDGADRLPVEASWSKASEFFWRAKILLDSLSDEVLREIVPHLEQQSGRWHPTGFMVFPLGIHKELGSLRLHIWPKGLRRVAPKGDTIHDHSWHLASRVLVGVYNEEFYSVEESDTLPDTEYARRESGLLRVFRTDYNPGSADVLITDGACVKVKLVEPRSIKAGNLHTIEAGVFHRHTILQDELAAALVLNSPTLGGLKQRILIDGPTDPINEYRQVISLEEKLKTKSQL